MDTKKVIGSRINEALAFSNKKQKELAAHLGVPDNTISYFCSGKRVPNAEQIIEISKFLGVSSDFLLGLSGDKTTDTKLRAICEYTGLGEDAVNKLRDDVTECLLDSDELYSFKQVRDYLIESDFFALFAKTYSSLYIDSRSWIEAVKQFNLGKAEFPDELDFKCDIHRYNIIKYAESTSDEFDIRVFKNKENTGIYKNKREQVQGNGKHNPPKE